MKRRAEQAVWLVSGSQPLVVKDVESYFCPRVDQSCQGCLFYKHLQSHFLDYKNMEVGIKKGAHFNHKLGLKDHTKTVPFYKAVWILKFLLVSNLIYSL